MILTKARPDFTGVWEMNLERSILRGPAPKRVVVEIEHHEPQLIQQIQLTPADGEERRLNFKYETGAETTNSIGGATAQTQARWEGMELVIESRIKTPGREAHFMDYWSLADDGRTLIMAHRGHDLAGQISILEKRSPAGTAIFD